MPEQLLHQFQIGAVFQQMGCKGVAQSLRGDFGLDLRLLLVFAQDFPKALTAEPLAVEIEKERERWL